METDAGVAMSCIPIGEVGTARRGADVGAAGGHTECKVGFSESVSVGRR